jgi:hypothetical protein
MRLFAGVFLCILLLISFAATAAEIVRPPSAAGPLYPADEKVLRETLQKCFDGSQGETPAARLLGCIAPHSGLGLSGPVAAQAFKELQPGQYDQVIILAASHFAQFQGCSIPAVQAFVTPLGLVMLDGPAIERLCYSPYISAQALHRTSREGRPLVHEQEYSVEVILPFLQMRLGSFKLVPILVGDMLDNSGKFSERILNTVAKAIQRIMGERTLLIASSDLTAFGDEFGFKPFKENPLAGVERLDRDAMDLFLERDVTGFQTYLERTGNPICGRQAIQVFLQLLPPQARGSVLAYAQSGRLMNTEDRSIGFAAINFYDPSKLPLTSQPQTASVSASAEPAAETAPAPPAPDAGTPPK